MWVFLSILAGFGDASRDALAKFATSRVPRVLVSWSFSAMALPFFTVLLIDAKPLPLPVFGLLLSVSVAHVVGGNILARALSLSDLSLCTPMVAFTPVFLLGVGPILTGEPPTLIGALGALLVVTGSYVLMLRREAGVFAPLTALRNEKGVQLMLLVSFLWAVTGCVEKVGVQHAGLAEWAVLELLLIAVMFCPLLFGQRRAIAAVLPREWGFLFLIGAANALSFGGYLLALRSAPVYYVICVKRASIFFSLLFGGVLYKEGITIARATGAALMFVGVAVISLWA